MRLIDADALLNSGFPTIYHTEFGDEVINTDDIRNAPTVELLMGRMTNGIVIPIERLTEPCYQTTSCSDCKMYDKDNHNCPRFCEVIKELVDEARPIGEWKLDDTEQFCYCSNCEDTYYPRPLDPSWNYCPNCGAKMKGAEK